jgi:RHS repeat-associated protein
MSRFHAAPLISMTLALFALVFLVRAAPAAKNAALQGPTTPILDDFNGRGNEDPLYQWGNWVPASIDGSGETLEILAGAVGQSLDPDQTSDSYRPVEVQGDAEVYATVARIPGETLSMDLYLHLSGVGGSTWNGYRVRWRKLPIADNLWIQRVDAGVATTLVEVRLDPVVGDALLLRRSGNALELHRRSAGNWSLLTTTSDATYQSGKIGLGVTDDIGRWDDFGGSGSATPPPAEPPLPSTNVLDDFNRPNEDPLSQGGGWADGSITGGLRLEVISQRAGRDPNPLGVLSDSYRPPDLTNDAEVYATVGALPGETLSSFLFLHVSNPGGSGYSGYRLRWRKLASNDNLWIERVDPGAVTALVDANPINPDPVTGDVLLLRRIGNQVQLWIRRGSTWTLIASATDSTYQGGKIGLGVTDDTARWDDFGGGGLPPPSAGPPPGQTYGTDANGKGIHGLCACRLFADPVNSRTGAFTTSVDDLETPGTGVSFAWSRSYTSADATIGRLGPGWTDSYSASLTVQGNGDVLLHGEDGQQLYYTKQQDGSFVGAPGSLSTLSLVGGVYKLVRTDQVTYTFTAQGVLTSMKDRNGQGVTLTYDGQSRLSTITDAVGQPATVSYNASNLVSGVQTQDGRSVGYGYTSGRLTSVTDARGKIWTYGYDAGGRLRTIIDPLQHTQVTNVYGPDGRVETQTDALGKSTTFAWDAATELATATDANQHVWKHDYEQNLIAKEIDPLGKETQLGHDPDLNTNSVTSPTNETTTMTYDPAGNLLQATAPASLGSVQKTFLYNARNDPELVTDARGKVTDYGYNPTTGNLTSVVQDGVQVAAYSHFPDGQVETFTDGNEKTWTYAYFPTTGYLQSVTDPLGNKTTYTYFPSGLVQTRVDPKGNVPGCNCAADFTWSYTYNPAGQLLTETDPLGHVTTTNVYDDAGRLESVTDANTHTTSYSYDDANRLRTETKPDPDGAGPLTAPVTSYTYDDVGNKRTETGPDPDGAGPLSGPVTTFAYDGANRLASETAPDPDGAGPLTAPVTTYQYDDNGNLWKQVEPRGNVAGCNCAADYTTTYTYDAAGRLKTETRPDPDGAGPQLVQLTTTSYDPVGNVQSVRDGNNHLTSYSHDAAGRILTVTAPDLGVTTYGYDDVGNLQTRRDDNQHLTTFAYDDAGRLRSETGPDPDGAGSQSPPLTTYTYDPNGNLQTLTDPNGNLSPAPGDGITTYGYDRANRQTSIDYSDATPDVTFGYDNVGNRTSMVDGSGTETRGYDNLDRLTSVTRGTNTFSYAYDPASNLTGRTYPGGAVTTYAYDALNRLSTAENASLSTSYAYDPASNLTTTTLPSANNHKETRVYDNAGRLIEVKNERTSPAQLRDRFVITLDPVGNPTQIVRTGALSQTQKYTYDASDRIQSVCFAASCVAGSPELISWTYDKVGNRMTETRSTGTTTYSYDARDRLLSAGATSYTYDQNGNELTAGSTTFTYDLANRLKTAVQGATTTTYSYDGEGKRLQASTGTQNSQKTNYLWDVSHSLPQLAQERNGANTLQRQYIYGLRRIRQTQGTGTYYLYDGLGSVVNTTAPLGALQKTYSYEPYGLIRTETGSSPTNFFHFTGEYRDPTGLYHLRTRQYDPANGRFLQTDPLQAAATEPYVSLYVYVGGRPTVLIDPSGMRFQAGLAGLRIARFAASIEPVFFGLPPIICIACNPGLNEWTIEAWQWFLRDMRETVRKVTPYLDECASGGVQGALLAKWSLQSAALGGLTGCGQEVLVKFLRDRGYKSAEWVDAGFKLGDLGQAYKGYAKKFSGKHLVVQLTTRAIGKTGLRIRVVYIARLP